MINLGVRVFIGFTDVSRFFGGPLILKLTPNTPSPTFFPTKIFPINGSGRRKSKAKAGIRHKPLTQFSFSKNFEQTNGGRNQRKVRKIRKKNQFHFRWLFFLRVLRLGLRDWA